MSCLVPTWHVLFLGEKLNLKPKHRRRRRRRRRLFVQTDPKILPLEDPLPRFGKEKKGTTVSAAPTSVGDFSQTPRGEHCVLPSGGKNTKKERNCVPTHKGFLSDACKILTGLPFFFPGIGSNSLVGGDCIPPGAPHRLRFKLVDSLLVIIANSFGDLLAQMGSYSHTPKVFTSVLPPVAKTFKITLDSFALPFFVLFLYVFFTRLPRLPVLSRASKLVNPGTKGSKRGASSCCLGSVPGRCFHSVYSKKAYSYLKRHGNWYRLAHVTPLPHPPWQSKSPALATTLIQTMGRVQTDQEATENWTLSVEVGTPVASVQASKTRCHVRH